MEPPSVQKVEKIKASGLTASAEQVNLIAEVVSSCSGLSRAELAATVCELLDWHRPSGGLKTRECRDLLERLEAAGLLELPGKAAGRPRGSVSSVPRTVRGEPGLALSGSVRDIAPVSLAQVSLRSDHALWRELIGRYHYLGHRTAYGASLRYLVWASQPSPAVVGCLQFSSPAWRMAVRDRWIGWGEPRRQECLQQVVNHSRFLILPWVKVRNLASHILGLSVQQVVADWQERFGVRPLLLETLVDAGRFSGTCYRAANWLLVGQTTGRGRMDRAHARHGATPKRVFLYPLVPEARELLRGPNEDTATTDPGPSSGGHGLQAGGSLDSC